MTPFAAPIINSLTDVSRAIASGQRSAEDYPLYTLHSHTEFCDGRAQMEAFARKAAEARFSVYGFSPHSPIYVESSCNMHRDNVSRYFAEVNRIRRDHADCGVTFLRGMEIDFLGSKWGPSMSYFQDMDLDYSIGSVHFIPSQDGQEVDIDGRFERFRQRMAQYFRNDIRYVVNTFFDRSLELVAAGGFDIIGHFDKVGHNADHFQPGIEQEGWYQSRLDELIQAIISSGVIVEINTKALAEHRRFFPAPEHWARLLSTGVPILVNSDAHVPALIDAGRPQAFSLLANLFTHGK